MWRVALSLPTVGASPGVRTRQALYSQNIDGYEVQGCGRGGCGSEVWLHARVLRGCEARCEILAGHGAGSNEHEDKESRCCRAPIIGFDAALQGRESPPNGLQLGKRTRGMFDQRVVVEGMGRGNGESITANAMTSRPTDFTKTIQCPAFVAYRRKEVCTHSHAKKRVCTPTKQPIRTHMSACTSDNKRYFVREP